MYTLRLRRIVHGPVVQLARRVGSLPHQFVHATSVPGRPHHDEPGVVGKLVPQCRDVGVQHHFLPHDTTRHDATDYLGVAEKLGRDKL